MPTAASVEREAQGAFKRPPRTNPRCHLCSIDKTLAGWVTYFADGRGGRGLQLGLLVSGVSLVAACGTLAAVVILRYREQRRWQSVKGLDAEFALVSGRWSHHHRDREGKGSGLAAAGPPAQQQAAAPGRSAAGACRRAAHVRRRLASSTPRPAIPSALAASAWCHKVQRIIPTTTTTNVSSPPPPPPQHDGKDPLAELIAATASRRRKGHSALAEKLLKECRIDQADIMFCRGSDGNLVQLGAGAYGQVGGWVVGGGQARRGGWVGGWADKEGGLSAGPWSVTPASSQPGCTRGSTCAAPILPPGILPTGGSP